MKVVAIKRDGTYLCEVKHAEIERFMNLYYGKMDKLKEGESLDLSKGYDWYHQTIAALKKTQDFIESNGKMISTIMTGIKMLGTNEQTKEK